MPGIGHGHFLSSQCVTLCPLNSNPLICASTEEFATVFVSFFPQPKLFFTSAAVWSLAAILFWFFGGEQLGARLRSAAGRGRRAAHHRHRRSSCRRHSSGSISTSRFAWLVFYAFWRWYSPHPWQNWSILVSALILFFTYFNVQISVAVNDWYGPFFDYVQRR